MVGFAEVVDSRNVDKRQVGKRCPPAGTRQGRTQQNRSRKIALLPGRCCRFPSGSGKRRTLVSPAVRSGACRQKDRGAGGRGTRQDGSARTIDAAARREPERMKPDLGRRSATAAARAPPPRACAAVARNPASIPPRRRTGRAVFPPRALCPCTKWRASRA